MGLSFAQQRGIRSSVVLGVLACGTRRPEGAIGDVVRRRAPAGGCVHERALLRGGVRRETLELKARESRQKRHGRALARRGVRALWVVSSSGDASASVQASEGGEGERVKGEGETKGMPLAAANGEKLRVLFAAGGTVNLLFVIQFHGSIRMRQ
jgi:hypothetical protein